MNKRMTY